MSDLRTLGSRYDLLGEAMRQRLQEFDTNGRYPIGPRIDIGPMRRSENVEDLRPRSIPEYLTNLIMGGAPLENLKAVFSEPFTSPSEIRNRQFREYFNQDRPAENSELARQLGGGTSGWQRSDLSRFLDPYRPAGYGSFGRFTGSRP